MVGSKTTLFRPSRRHGRHRQPGLNCLEVQLRTHVKATATAPMTDTNTSDLLAVLQSLEAELGALRGSMATLRADLSGKDWLTAGEAAHYCGVSVAQFNAKAPECGLEPRSFMGKKLYEKAGLHRAIHDARPWARTATSGIAPAPSSPDAAEALARLARYERKRAPTMGTRK
jgi:hypothetical protein